MIRSSHKVPNQISIFENRISATCTLRTPPHHLSYTIIHPSTLGSSPRPHQSPPKGTPPPRIPSHTLPTSQTTSPGLPSTLPSVPSHPSRGISKSSRFRCRPHLYRSSNTNPLFPSDPFLTVSRSVLLHGATSPILWCGSHFPLSACWMRASSAGSGRPIKSLVWTGLWSSR